MELEKSIQELKKLVELRKNKCGKIKFDTCICETKDLDTVLKGFETLKEENCALRDRQGLAQFREIKTEELSEALSPYYIQKNKIKEKIKELDNKPIKIYTSNKKYYYETDKYNDIIKQILQELLED